MNKLITTVNLKRLFFPKPVIQCTLLKCRTQRFGNRFIDVKHEPSPVVPGGDIPLDGSDDAAAVEVEGGEGGALQPAAAQRQRQPAPEVFVVADLQT